MGYKGRAREKEWNNDSKKGIRKRQIHQESKGARDTNCSDFRGLGLERGERQERSDDLDCCQRSKSKMGGCQKKSNEREREKERELRYTSRLSSGWLCNVHNAGV